MTLPIYESRSHALPALSHGNKGLYFERFFDRYTTSSPGKVSVGDGVKLVFLKQFSGLCGNSTQLQQYALRQLALIDSLKKDTKEQGQGYELNGHFVTGMGNSHPVENGFLWHYTLGVPYLTGSQVKGLVRSLLEQYYKEADRNNILLTWFGSASKELEDENEADKDGLRAGQQQGHRSENHTGELIFFDALPVAPVKLGVDIMTPHMGKWYLDGAKIEKIDEDSDKIPADWHDPTPIPFLVVQEAKFLFTIARRQGSNIKIEDVFSCLDKALEHLGAGAKTQVGYGYMQANPDIITELKALQQKNAMQQQLASASGPDKIRLKVQQMKAEGQLVAALSKNFNKFKAKMGSEFNVFCRTLAEQEPALLAKWEQSDKNTNENKAFKKVARIINGGDQ